MITYAQCIASRDFDALDPILEESGILVEDLDDDPDLDGRSTYLEIAQGTDPFTPDSAVFEITQEPEEGLQITYSSIANPLSIGWQFQLQETDDLAEDGWTGIMEETAFDPENRTRTLLLSYDDPDEFYRLLTNSFENTAPVITAIELDINEEEPTNVIFPESDPDGQAPQYSVDMLQGEVDGVFSVNALTLTGQTDYVGAYEALATVTDGFATRSAIVSGNVLNTPDAPYWIREFQDTATSAITLDPENDASDPDSGAQLSFGINLPGEDWTSSKDGNTLTWQGPAEAEGIFPISLFVQDETGLKTDSNTFTYTKELGDLPPEQIKEFDPLYTIPEGASLELLISEYYTEPNGQPMTMPIVGAQPGEVTTDNAKTVFRLLDENGFGEYQFQIYATDGELDSPQKELNIKVEAVNDPPVFDQPPGDFQILQGASVQKEYDASDVDQDPLIVVASDYDADALGFTQNGLTPTFEAIGTPGTYPVTLRVFDGELYSDPVTIDVEILQDIPEPTIDTPTGLTVPEDEELLLNIADFASGQISVYELYCQGNLITDTYVTTEGETISWASPGVYSFIGAPDQSYTITGLVAKVINEEDESAQTDSFSVERTPVPDAPRWVAEPPTSISVDVGNSTSLDLTTEIYDPEQPDSALEAEIIGASHSAVTPNGLGPQIEGQTVGTDIVTIRVTDGTLYSEDRTLEIIVTDPVPTVNTPSGLTTQEGQEYILDLNDYSSPNAQLFRLFQEGNANELLTGSTLAEGEKVTKISEGVYKFEGANIDAFGIVSGLYFEAENSEQETAQSGLFGYVRQNVNDAPTLSDPADVEMNVGTQLELDFGPNANDIDNIPAELTAIIEGLSSKWQITPNGLTPTVEAIGPATTETATVKIYDGQAYSNTQQVQFKSNAVQQTVNAALTFRDLSTDQIMTGGITVEYQELNNQGTPVGSLQTVNDNDGVIDLVLKQGVDYQINGKAENAIDLAAKGEQGYYLYIRGDAHEQRSEGDTSSIINLANTNNQVTMYKIPIGFPLFNAYLYASLDNNSQNVGTRRFAYGTVPVFIDTTTGTLTTDQFEQLEFTLNEIETLSNGRYTFPIQQGSSAPSQPYVHIRIADESNGCVYNQGVMSLVTVSYSQSSSKETVVEELGQGLFGLREFGSTIVQTTTNAQGMEELNQDISDIIKHIIELDHATKY